MILSLSNLIITSIMALNRCLQISKELLNIVLNNQDTDYSDPDVFPLMQELEDYFGWNEEDGLSEYPEITPELCDKHFNLQKAIHDGDGMMEDTEAEIKDMVDALEKALL